MSDDLPRPGCPVCRRPMSVAVVGTSVINNAEFWFDQVLLVPGDAILTPEHVDIDGACICGFKPTAWEVG